MKHIHTIVWSKLFTLQWAVLWSRHEKSWYDLLFWCRSGFGSGSSFFCDGSFCSRSSFVAEVLLWLGTLVTGPLWCVPLWWDLLWWVEDGSICDGSLCRGNWSDPDNWQTSGNRFYVGKKNPANTIPIRPDPDLQLWGGEIQVPFSVINNF